MTCLQAVAASSALAQEYSPVVNDRVELPDVQPAMVEDDSKRKGGWEIAAVISAAYDDNIFLSSRNPESDIVFRAAPVIAYVRGEEKEGEGAFVKAGYRPTGVVYSDHRSENRVDHQAAVTAGWKGKVTRLTYEGAFQKLGDATADTGRPTDRIEFENELRIAWIPREKVSLEAAIGNSQSDYADPLYFDSKKFYGEIAARYAYSPKTEIGIIYQAGRFKVDGTGAQDTQQLTGNLNWQPREKIRVNLETGAEHRKTDNGTSVNPVVEGRLDWTPRQGTEIFATAYMREEASAFYAGQNYSVRGATAGISQRLGGKFSGKLEGGYEKNRYDQVSGSGEAGRNDRIWFIRPALVWKYADESDLSFFYRISDNASNDPAFGYDQQMIGIELNHKF